MRLIAFDLDNTLLNSAKEITPENVAALTQAAEAGIECVPATGRFRRAMPESVRRFSLFRYAITSNGARIFDGDRVLASAEIPPDRALEILRFLDAQSGLLYECTMDGWGWMSRGFYERLEEFAPEEHSLKLLRELRTPVDDLIPFVESKGRGLEKIQAFTWDGDLRARLLQELPKAFPEIVVSTSSGNNLEVNDRRATKGEALRTLARLLGIDISETLAFGDDRNDLSMLRAAGVGVAMGNASPEVRAAADFVTSSCEESGVAAGIRRFACPCL